MRRPRKIHGAVIWQGPSELDGKPVVLIATRGTRNKENQKTGALIQTYILRSGISPVKATKTGADVSICGECPHRKHSLGSCYVRVEQGPLNVYKAFRRGAYPTLTPGQVSEQLFKGENVRLGAYGDPAAIPFHVWQDALGQAKAVTGYTHQWRTCDQRLRQYSMASCDTIGEASEAGAMDWRTFTVVPKGYSETPAHAFLCPASEEAGKKLTCSECMACGGKSSPNKASVFIPVHGVAFKQSRFTQGLITIERSGANHVQ